MRMRTPVAVACLVATMLTGCVSGMRGAPQPFLGRKEVSTVFGSPSTAIKTLSEADTPSERNAAINDLIGIIDGRYHFFAHNLEANRKHAGALVDTAQLLSGIAGSMTTSAVVKGNYLSLMTLLQGGQGVYDQHYMYEKTVAALISQMETSRNRQLMRIMEKMKWDLNDYPSRMVAADLIVYYQAGTLAGATRALQANAAVRSEEATEALDRKIPTDDDIFERGNVTVRLTRLVDEMSEEDKAKLWQFIATKDPKLASSSTFKKSLINSLKQLSHRQYLDNSTQLIKDIEATGIKMPEVQ